VTAQARFEVVATRDTFEIIAAPETSGAVGQP